MRSWIFTTFRYARNKMNLGYYDKRAILTESTAIIGPYLHLVERQRNYLAGHANHSVEKIAEVSCGTYVACTGRVDAVMMLQDVSLL